MTTIANSKTVAPPNIVPVRLLSDLSTADVPYAGGRGANLGQLTRLGLPVPPGYVVGSPAYAAFRRQTGLAERLEELLGKFSVEDTVALQAAAEQARDAITDTEMPAWLAEAIGTAYEELSNDELDAPVAVRSSPTAEDTATASLAGMNQTFLNVRGHEAVIDAVKQCWQSLFGARTVYYRAERGFGQTDMDVAVVVQRQIPSTRAGVMFTIDPASGERDHLAIDGSFALGESVVSSQLSPDRYVVEKSTMVILTRSVRSKEPTVEATAGGGTATRASTPDESRRSVLSDEEVLRLAELGIAIEREYGSPQDTEWAFDPDGKIWILQSHRSRLATPTSRGDAHPGGGG
jgi:pyruvate,water dikinase